MKQSELNRYRETFIKMLHVAGIAINEQEQRAIELADFGLGEFAQSGLGLIVYENNDRYCAKELIMLPRQTCPQHLHPPIKDASGRLIDPGKRETFRCRWGKLYLYIDGDPAAHPLATPPAGSESHYTVWHEIVLHPGEQYTIEPGTWHWFQADDNGAIVSEFSTTSRDEADIFTDTRIRRITEIEDD